MWQYFRRPPPSMKLFLLLLLHVYLATSGTVAMVLLPENLRHSKLVLIWGQGFRGANAAVFFSSYGKASVICSSCGRASVFCSSCGKASVFCSSCGKATVFCSSCGSASVYCSSCSKVSWFCSSCGKALVFCSSCGKASVFCSSCGNSSVLLLILCGGFTVIVLLMVLIQCTVHFWQCLNITGQSQGWEFSHRFSERITRFFAKKNERMCDSLKK